METESKEQILKITKEVKREEKGNHSWERVAGVADEQACLADGSISDGHTLDEPGSA